METKKQLRLIGLLLNAMNSDNTDYILEQLSRIYTMIYSNNIAPTTEFKELEVKEKCF